MLQSLLIPFLTTCLAELGDKSQFSILLLSSRFKNHIQLLIGIMFAFLIVDGSAILLGAWITALIPNSILNIISGAVFIVFGIFALKPKLENDEINIRKKSAFISGFTMIFFAEWGDKTQITSALFAAQYNPFLVLISVLAAMTLLSTAAIYIGKVFLHTIDKKIVSKISGILFIIIGLTTIFFTFV